jgi:hypothetical protein
MPAASAKQKKFMDAAAHNPAFAKKAGVPVKVAKEFSKASKGQTFKEDGEMKDSKAMVKKEIGFMKAKGAPKSMMKHEMAEMKGMKKGYASGGMPMVMKDGQKVPAFAADGKGKMAHGGMTKEYGMGGMLKKIASRAAPAVKAAASQASPAMRSSVGNMGGALNKIAQQVAPAVKAAASQASPAMRSSVSNAVKKAVPAIKRAFGRGLAEGGNVTKMGAVKTSKPTSGSASSRADGIAQKGKTKGKMLQKGGKC